MVRCRPVDSPHPDPLELPEAKMSAIAGRKPRIWWLLALGLVVACLVIAVVARPGPDPKDERPPPRTKSVPSRTRTPALEDAPPSTPPNLPPLRQPEAQ